MFSVINEKPNRNSEKTLKATRMRTKGGEKEADKSISGKKRFEKREVFLFRKVSGKTKSLS
mgnify:CR=1 FL=1